MEDKTYLEGVKWAVNEVDEYLAFLKESGVSIGPRVAVAELLDILYEKVEELEEDE